MLKKTLFLLVVLLFTGTSLAEEEKLTITTYYPSPYGSYNELQTNRMIIAPANSVPDKPTEGMMFYSDGTITGFDRGLWVYVNRDNNLVWEQLASVFDPASEQLLASVNCPNPFAVKPPPFIFNYNCGCSISSIAYEWVPYGQYGYIFRFYNAAKHHTLLGRQLTGHAVVRFTVTISHINDPGNYWRLSKYPARIYGSVATLSNVNYYILEDVSTTEPKSFTQELVVDFANANAANIVCYLYATVPPKHTITIDNLFVGIYRGRAEVPPAASVESTESSEEETSSTSSTTSTPSVP